MIHDLRFIVRDGKKILQRYMGNKALFSNPMQLVGEWQDIPCVYEKEITKIEGGVFNPKSGQFDMKTIYEKEKPASPPTQKEPVTTGEITLHFDGKESVRTVVEKYNKTAPHGAKLTVDGVEPVINNDDKILVTGQTNIPDGVYTLDELKTTAKRSVSPPPQKETEFYDVKTGDKCLMKDGNIGVYVTKEMLAKAFEIQWYANSEDMNESLKVMASYLGFPND